MQDPFEQLDKEFSQKYYPSSKGKKTTLEL